MKHTSFLFNQFSYFSGLVDVAIVKDKDATGAWIRVCKWYLVVLGKFGSVRFRAYLPEP